MCERQRLFSSVVQSCNPRVINESLTAQHRTKLLSLFSVLTLPSNSCCLLFLFFFFFLVCTFQGRLLISCRIVSDNTQLMLSIFTEMNFKLKTWYLNVWYVTWAFTVSMRAWHVKCRHLVNCYLMHNCLQTVFTVQPVTFSTFLWILVGLDAMWFKYSNMWIISFEHTSVNNKID